MMRTGPNSLLPASKQLSSNFNQAYTENDVGTDKTNCQVMVDKEWCPTCSSYDESVGMYMNAIIKAVDPTSRTCSVQIKTTCTLAKNLQIANNTFEGVPFHLVRRQPVGGELKRLNNKKRSKRREEPVEFDLKGIDAKLFYGSNPSQPRAGNKKIKHLVRMMLGSVQPNPDFYLEWREADLAGRRVGSFEPHGNTTVENINDYIELKCLHDKLVFEFGDARVPGAFLPWLRLHKQNCRYIQLKLNTSQRLRQLRAEIARLGEGADTSNLETQQGDLMEESAAEFVDIEANIARIRSELSRPQLAPQRPAKPAPKPSPPRTRKPPRPNTLPQVTVTPPPARSAPAPQPQPGAADLMRMPVCQTQTVTTDAATAHRFLAVPPAVDGYSSAGTADIEIDQGAESDSWEPSRSASGATATVPVYDIDQSQATPMGPKQRKKYFNYDFIKITKRHGRRGRPTQTWVRVLPAKHGFIAPGQIPDILLSENAKVLSDYREKQQFEWDSYEIMENEERDRNLCDGLRDLERDAKRVSEGSMDWLHFFKKHRYALENHAFLGGDVSFYAVGKVTKFERLTVPLLDTHHFNRSAETPRAMLDFMNVHPAPFKHELAREHIEQYLQHRANIKDGPKDHRGWLECPEHLKRYYKALAQELIQTGFKGKVSDIAVLSCTVMSGKLAKCDGMHWGAVKQGNGHWCYELVVRVRLSDEDFANVMKYQRNNNCVLPYQLMGETYNSCRFQEMQKPRIPEHQKYHERAQHDWLAGQRGTSKHPPQYADMLKEERTDLRETLRKGQPKVARPQPPAFTAPARQPAFVPTPAPINTAGLPSWNLMPPPQYPLASLHTSPNHFQTQPSAFWGQPMQYLPVPGSAHGLSVEGLRIAGAGGMQMVQDAGQLTPGFTPGQLAPPSPIHVATPQFNPSPLAMTPYTPSKFVPGDIVTGPHGGTWQVTGTCVVVGHGGFQQNWMLLCTNVHTGAFHNLLETNVRKATIANVSNEGQPPRPPRSPATVPAGIPADDQPRHSMGMFVPAPTLTPMTSRKAKASPASSPSDVPSRPSLIRDRSACTDRSPTTSPPASARGTPTKEGFPLIRGEGMTAVRSIPVWQEAIDSQKTAMKVMFGQQNTEGPTTL